MAVEGAEVERRSAPEIHRQAVCERRRERREGGVKESGMEGGR